MPWSSAWLSCGRLSTIAARTGSTNDGVVVVVVVLVLVFAVVVLVLDVFIDVLVVDVECVVPVYPTGVVCGTWAE